MDSCSLCYTCTVSAGVLYSNAPSVFKSFYSPTHVRMIDVFSKICLVYTCKGHCTFVWYCIKANYKCLMLQFVHTRSLRPVGGVKHTKEFRVRDVFITSRTGSNVLHYMSNSRMMVQIS